jgi:ankyrin repeat protein
MSDIPSLDAPMKQVRPSCSLLDAVKNWNESWLPEPSQIQAFIAHGADVNARDDDGMTALMWAVRNDKKECLRSLIAAGADVNAADARGRAALDYAIVEPRVECAQLLLMAGANVNGNQDASVTPLYRAAVLHNCVLMKALISAGADVNARDTQNGWTVLMRAANEPCLACVKALLAAGANPEAKDKDGETAVTWAQTTGRRNDKNAVRYDEVVALLREAAGRWPGQRP